MTSPMRFTLFELCVPFSRGHMKVSPMRVLKKKILLNFCMLLYYVSLRSEFRVVMSVTIPA